MPGSSIRMTGADELVLNPLLNLLHCDRRIPQKNLSRMSHVFQATHARRKRDKNCQTKLALGGRGRLWLLCFLGLLGLGGGGVGRRLGEHSRERKDLDK